MRFLNRVLRWLPPATLLLLPMLWVTGYALAYSLGLVGVMQHGWTLVYWKRVLTDPVVWRAWGFSAYVALVAAGSSWLLALGIWKAFRRWIVTPGNRFAMSLPLSIPPVVAAFVLHQTLSGGGWLARITFQLGWIARPESFPVWIQDTWGAGILWAHIWMAAPFFILLFERTWAHQHLPELLALGKTLGASPLQNFLRIECPLYFQTTRINLFLYGLMVFGAYDIPLLLGVQSPQMISVLTLRKFELFDLGQKPEAYVLAFLYTVLMVWALLWVRPMTDASNEKNTS